MEGFPLNLNDTFNSTRECAEPIVRSRSHLKVKYLTNKYYTLCRVRSITHLLMEGFPSNLNDTFTSTRGCAEPMLLMCQLKVKVTIKCQINQNLYTPKNFIEFLVSQVTSAGFSLAIDNWGSFGPPYFST